MATLLLTTAESIRERGYQVLGKDPFVLEVNGIRYLLARHQVEYLREFAARLLDASKDQPKE